MSILNEYVQEIVSNPGYLTKDNIDSLLDCLRKLVPDDLDGLDVNIEVAEIDSPMELGPILRKLTRTAEKMYRTASSSSNNDDLRKAAGILKQVIDTAIKYSDKINATDRAIKVENALVSALNKFCDERTLPTLKDEFMEFLRVELDG